MGTYEMVVAVEPGVVSEYEAFVHDWYLPALHGTGCFDHVEFDRLTHGQYRLRLYPKSEATFERYLHDEAPNFKKAFLTTFPKGVVEVRQVPGTAEFVTRDEIYLNRLREAND